MAKCMTPAIEKWQKKNAKELENGKSYSLGRDVWRRLRKNRLAFAGLIIISVFVLMAIFAEVISPYDPNYQDFSATFQRPCAEHLLGTDNLGRDIFSRILFGARVSIPVGLLCVLVSMIIGGGIGLLGAFLGGEKDNILMRIMDIFQSIPGTVLAIAIIAAFGNGIMNLIIAIAVSMMPACARTCRAAIYTVKGNEYILAAQTIGASPLRQVFKYMLPNALGPIIVTATFQVATDILIISALSYIGMGIVSPTVEWGAMLSDAKDYMRQAPHIIIAPGVMIMLTVFSINVLGDGLRDALDPRLK